MSLTLCTLLYGDYPALAERVLGSFTLGPVARLPVVIGTNAVSRRVDEFVTRWLTSQPPEREVSVYASSANVGKYPLMRQMLHDTATPITSDAVAWFDDDSWLLETAPDDWEQRALSALSGAAIVGDDRWRVRLQPDQAKFFSSWRHSNNVQMQRHQQLRIVTGGFWLMPMSIIREYSWPPKNMLHNGGDVAFSVLCHQNGLTMRRFVECVAINSDESRKCSSMPRRGMSQPPYGTLAWSSIIKKEGMDPYADV